jgi:hypothetical protein
MTTGSTDWAVPCATRRLRNHVKKTTGKPCAGKPHARIERGMGKRAREGTAPLTTNVASWKLVQACGWKSRPGRYRSAR